MEKKTRGLRNNNPFNIRKSKSRWLGKIKGSDKEFETFDSMEHGYRAGLKLLSTYYKKYKLHSYRVILQRFAPISENNLADYEYYIFAYTRIKPDAFITLNTLLWKIAPRIAKYESAMHDDDIIFEVTTEFCKNYSI